MAKTLAASPRRSAGKEGVGSGIFGSPRLFSKRIPSATGSFAGSTTRRCWPRPCASWKASPTPPAEADYWNHGHSTETDFIFVTTQTLTHEHLARLSEDVGSKRSLLGLMLSAIPLPQRRRLPKTSPSRRFRKPC